MSWRDHVQVLATIAFAIVAVATVIYGAIALDDYALHRRRMNCLRGGHTVGECVLAERCK